MKKIWRSTSTFLSQLVHEIRGQGFRFWQETIRISWPFGCVLLISVIAWHSLEYRRELNLIRQLERNHLEIAFQFLTDEFQSIESDLLVLSKSHSLRQFLVSQSERDRQVLEQDYLVFSNHKRIYDQVRFLDARGQERVRVNWNNGYPALVAQADLQDKSQRYYFKDTYQLNAGKIFVSPLDLNIENQAIEQPFKPMIRFGTPVYQATPQPVGVVLLNYCAAIMLQRLESLLQSKVNQPMLLNAEGYWLMAPNPEDEWGFMLGHEQRTFAREYPNVWPILRQQRHGQIQTDAGIFTFVTLHPLTAGMASSTGSPSAAGASQHLADRDEYVWKIVSRVPGSLVVQMQRRHFSHILEQSVLLWGVLLCISALVAKARMDNQRSIVALKTSERRLRVITSELANGLLVVDQCDRLVLMNPEAERLLGWPERKLLGQKIHDLIHRSRNGTPMPPGDCGVLLALREGKTMRVQQDRFIRADGSTMMVSYSASPIWEAGQVTGVVVDFHDVTQQHQEHEQLSHMASCDPLTGVFNRRELERRMAHMIHGAQQTQTTFALLLLDIDHFKRINDTYGHLAGDQVLRQLTRLLTQSLRRMDVIARYGGEEFVVLLPNAGCDRAYLIAERLRQTMMTRPIAVGCAGEVATNEVDPKQAATPPYQLQSRWVQITVSVGVAMYPAQGDRPDTLIEFADQMLYRAKHDGRNRVKMISPEVGYDEVDCNDLDCNDLDCNCSEIGCNCSEMSGSDLDCNEAGYDQPRQPASRGMA